jgi:hypothetical protein
MSVRLPRETILSVLQYELEQLQGEDVESQNLRREIKDAIESLPNLEKQPQGTLFAFHVREDGFVDFVGEIICEVEGFVRMEVCDAIMLTGCGLWQLSGEIKDLPRSKCRIFNDMAACYESAMKINSRIGSK